MLDQNAPHRLGGGMKKMGAVRKTVLPGRQPKISLVNQRRRLERMPHALMRHAMASQNSQFVVNLAEQIGPGQS